MVSWTGGSRETIAQIAGRHGFGEGAGAAMAEALAQSGGAMAQFHHAELGGMGQWSRGGMLMIGDMFNDGLKARVRALAEDLAEALHRNALTYDRASAAWWPDALGSPSSTGAQNGRRYAVFPDKGRLAIETDGRVRLYDTGAHRISGASQQQGGGSTLSFGSDRGTVGLDAFAEVAGQAAGDATAAPRAAEARTPEPAAGPSPAARPSSEFQARPETAPMAAALAPSPAEGATSRPAAQPAGPAGDPITLIQRLAELKSAGILSEEEFSAKKAELLSRL